MNSQAVRRTFSKRFKQARLAAGLSQKRLGIEAGLDEFVASTRVNRYEQGKHEADLKTAQKMASVLRVPLAYFYVEDDALAEIVRAFYHLDAKQRNALADLVAKAK